MLRMLAIYVLLTALGTVISIMRSSEQRQFSKAAGRDSLVASAGMFKYPAPPCGRLSSSSDGRNSNWFAWSVFISETAKSRYPEYDLYKLLLGEKADLSLLELMEANLELLPAEKKFAAAEKILETKQDIRLKKIRQFDTVISDVSLASLERLKHRFGADYKAAVDGEDLPALLKLLEKTHLTSSKTSAKGVVELENRLYAERQSSRLIFDFNVLYRQLLEAICAAKAADPAFVRDTYLSSASIVERYSQALGSDFVDWKAKEMLVLSAAGSSVLDIMSAAELWWQDAAERARDLGYSRPITTLSGLKSKEMRRDRAYIAEDSDNESLFSANSALSVGSSVSSYNSASHRKSHVSRSKKSNAKASSGSRKSLSGPKSALRKPSSYSDQSSVASGSSRSSYASGSAARVRFTGKAISKYPAAAVTKHRGDAGKPSGCGICVAAIAAGVIGLKPLTHSAEHCSFKPRLNSSHTTSVSAQSNRGKGGRGAKRGGGRANHRPSRDHALVSQELLFQQLISENARVNSVIAGDRALMVQGDEYSSVDTDEEEDLPDLVGEHDDDDELSVDSGSDVDTSLSAGSEFDRDDFELSDSSVHSSQFSNVSSEESLSMAERRQFSFADTRHRALIVAQLDSFAVGDNNSDSIVSSEPELVAEHLPSSADVLEAEMNALLASGAVVSTTELSTAFGAEGTAIYARGLRARMSVDGHASESESHSSEHEPNLAISNTVSLQLVTEGSAPGRCPRYDDQNLFPGEFLSIYLDTNSNTIRVRDQATQRILVATVTKHSDSVYREVLRQAELYFLRRQGIRARYVVVHSVVVSHGMLLPTPATEGDYRNTGQPWAGTTTRTFTENSIASEVTYSYFRQGRRNLRVRQLLRELVVYRAARPYTMQLSQAARSELGNLFASSDNADVSRGGILRADTAQDLFRASRTSLAEQFILTAIDSRTIQNDARSVSYTHLTLPTKRIV